VEATKACDLCGVPIRGGTEIFAVVADSSCIYPAEADFDGNRLVVACTTDHLAEIVAKYRQRPFVQEELWAGKIAREQVSPGDQPERIAAATGLTVAQVLRATAWHDSRDQTG
jgi:hypothetical protein